MALASEDRTTKAAPPATSGLGLVRTRIHRLLRARYQCTQAELELRLKHWDERNPNPNDVADANKSFHATQQWVPDDCVRVLNIVRNTYATKNSSQNNTVPADFGAQEGMVF